MVFGIHWNILVRVCLTGTKDLFSSYFSSLFFFHRSLFLLRSNVVHLNQRIYIEIRVVFRYNITLREQSNNGDVLRRTETWAQSWGEHKKRERKKRKEATVKTDTDLAGVRKKCAIMIVIIEFVTTITSLPLVQRSAALALFLFSRKQISFLYTLDSFFASLLCVCVCVVFSCITHSLNCILFFSLKNSSTLFYTCHRTVIMHSSYISLILYTFDLKTINVQASSTHTHTHRGREKEIWSERCRNREFEQKRSQSRSNHL